MAATFGGVAAFVLLWKPPPPAPVIIVQPSATPSAKPENTAATLPTGSPESIEDQGDAGADASAKFAPPGGAKPTDPKATPSSTGSANIDMSGFSGQAVGGPTPTEPAPPSTGGGGMLSAGEINGVVAGGQSLIRRKCWQPALDARAGSGPSARVNVSIVIDSSGSVQSSTASGAEKDYPGLSSCIASRIKGWQFPASGGTTPVNIPFFFAAQ